MRRFSRWLSCFLFITRPWLRAGWCPTVLISLNSHNRPVPIHIHRLLQIGCRCPRPYFEASGQSLAADEARMSADRLQHRFIPVDPERDPVGVVVACVLPDPLHPVHYFAGQTLLPKRLIQPGVQRGDKRAVALHQPIAGYFPLDRYVLGKEGDRLTLELQRGGTPRFQTPELNRRERRRCRCNRRSPLSVALPQSAKVRL